MRVNEKLILALPKGRILDEVMPLLAQAGIEPEPEFDNPRSRALRFATNHEGLDLIRVRNFDVATFVAFGAAHLGVAGNDVLMEFEYPELYAPLDLGIGRCRMAVAAPAESVANDDPSRWSHVRVATKYPEITRRHFAGRGVQAECIKLNGAMELAPLLGLCRRIVDLVQTGDTLRANGLVEIEHVADITSRLIVNRAALKTRPEELGGWLDRFSEAANAARLATGQPDFADRFQALLDAKRETAEDVDRAVAEIIEAVRARGDAAVREYTARFDRLDLAPDQWRVGREEIEAARGRCAGDALAALDLAAVRIEEYHRRQRPDDFHYRDAAGIELGSRWRPVDAVGLYVPGGTAAYPSSVLMNAVPAKVAGVGRLVMVVPAPDGRLNPLVLAAAARAGVDEIYRIGGAQAVAALAYGTGTIRPVDKIVGPGNAYVAAAKRRVFGTVGIDMIAGPSEILVVADRDNDPDWIAADLLSQAEHDTSAQSILVADDDGFAERVAAAVERRLGGLPRRDIAAASWRDNGAIVTVRGWDEAVALVDRVAPEHLQLAVADPEALADRVRHAGAIFLGRLTPEAVGDYVGGPNHVLPTARSARFSSGLGVLDFMKRTSLLRCGPEGLAAIGPAAVTLARAEGLEAHALSVALRLGRP